MKELVNKKVVIAMSGGIDSSVAAALLKKGVACPELSRRIDVIGVFMKFWSEPGKDGDWNRCCSPEAEKRARWVAKSLGIPFYVFNVEKEFKKKIVDYFLNEYKKGITPNPCVVCNKEIKFGLLLERALALGTDYVATGHYARIKTQNLKRKAQNHSLKLKTYKLLKGRDEQKDQSYFLWQLNQKQLKHILFPVGNYTKKQVRGLARRFKLPILNIKESQEICFVKTTINDFLKRYLKEKPGKIITRSDISGASPVITRSDISGASPVIDKKGKILGFHQGLHFYTIGQRKGLGFSGGPYFVLDKNIKKNLLIVTKNEKDLLKRELTVKNINWISGKNPKLPLKVKVKIRYRQELVSAIIKGYKKNRVRAVFLRPQRAITSGQSVVFYWGQEILGGGIIE